MPHEFVNTLRSPVLFAALLLFAVAGTPAEAAKLRFDFLSSAAPAAPSGTAAAVEDRPLLEEGAELVAGAVLDLMTASAADSEPKALFSDTVLLVQISDAEGAVLMRDVIGGCAALDLVHGEGTFAESADCDGDRFGYTVSAEGITLQLNQEPFRDYLLEPGAYDINGVPVRIE